MKKLIHLSDLHVGYNGMHDIFDGMIDRLIYLYKPANDYVVVITGDLVDDATKGGPLDDVLAQFKRIRDAGFHLFIVPGNHDYGTGNLATKHGMQAFKAAVYGDENKSFPMVEIVGGIALIGLDSMKGEIDQRQGMLANGEIGNDQLNELERILSSPEVRNCSYKVVCLHHHPIDSGGIFKQITHGLDDAAKLKTVLAGHPIDALLFGHNHDGKPWNGNWGIMRAYDAGSSTGKGRKGPHRVIDLSKPTYTDINAEL